MSTKVTFAGVETEIEIGAGYFDPIDENELDKDFLFWIQTNHEAVTVKITRRQLVDIISAMEYINNVEK